MAATLQEEQQTGAKVIWRWAASLQTGGSERQISPSPGGPGHQYNTMLLKTTRVSLPKIPSNVLSRAHECDRRHTYIRTYRRTDHATIAIRRIALGDVA